MDESRLNLKLRKIPEYQGSFAVNELHQIKLTQRTLVAVNLDDRESSGSHWIGLCITNEDVFICDSLGGLTPDVFPTPLVSFLFQLTKTRKLTITKQLQPEKSILCGYYVIFFIRQLSKTSFKNFISVFSKNLEQNDVIIKFLVKYFVAS